MARKQQPTPRPSARSTNPEDYQRVARAVAAMPKDFAAGHVIAPHRHTRAQVIYATAGTMRVSTDAAVWVVPPQRALWMPAGMRHSIAMSGDVTMRTLYLRHDAAAGMPNLCRVLKVSPLLRELIVRATELPMHYDERGAAGHVVALILDELHHERSLPLHLPMPRDKRLRALCEALLDQPGDPRTLEEWAPATNASPRTLARLFVAETGLTFGGPAGRRPGGNRRGARPGLRQRQRLQRDVPPRGGRVAERV
jgi:quercetin dioxygenase-like cupin family protein/AraC-like DNA-binding protein